MTVDAEHADDARRLAVLSCDVVDAADGWLAVLERARPARRNSRKGALPSGEMKTSRRRIENT